MAQIPTKYFGPMEYHESDVVQFPSGLPAFEQETQFLALAPPASAPLVFLQSLHQPSLCFLSLPILAVYPDYHLAVTTEDLRSLELPLDRQPRIGDDVTCLAILAVAENGPITANLLAPIVINPGRRRAVQAIRVDSVYSHQHPVPKLSAPRQEDICS